LLARQLGPSRARELRGLAVTSPERSALAPDLPTLREIDLAAAETASAGAR
jgi:tripartite-type tricarboxylate transporter receptor subunit TctC